ncbi:MAG TPA: hypothetical protein PLG59_13580 [bacterium]|nr:hypothetical protein [bacterium]
MIELHPDFKEFLSMLNSNEVRYLAVGGYAVPGLVESSASWTETMTTTCRKAASQFALCIHTDDPDLLTPRMVYEVLSDEDARESAFVRVIDNEGEDYLYPSGYFVFVEFPQAVKEALLNADALSMPVRTAGGSRSVGSERK